MPYAGLLFALVLPVALGVALLAASLGRGSATREPGLVPWILGAGWIVGMLAVSLLMRGLARAGVPFGVLSIGVPTLLLAAASAWLAWRRHRSAILDNLRGARQTLCATGFTKNARLAWYALLAWIALRATLLLAEVCMRPLYAWDAWSAWATKAKTFFSLGTIVPFVDAAGWIASTTPVWFDAAPAQPVTLPLVQAWIATAMGAWDDARVGLPWWLFFVAILLIVYGETRQRDIPPLPCLVAAWLAGSLPLLGTQVALAGYADLPLAAAFALGSLAGVRAIEGRSPIDIVAVIAALAAAPLMKSSGWVWIVVALPGFAAAVLGSAWHRRIAVGLAVAAICIVGVAARFPKLVVGPISFAYAPVWGQFAVDGILLANWHLLAFGIAGTLALRWRRLMAPDVAPLTFIAAAGAGWIAMLAAFPAVRHWGADALGLNRAVLVLAPFLVVWMVVALRDAPVRAATDASGVAPQPA